MNRFLSIGILIFLGYRTWETWVNLYYLALIISFFLLSFLFSWFKKPALFSFLTGSFVSYSLLDLIFFEVEFDRLLAEFKNLNYYLLFPSALFIILSHVVQCVRWKVILQEIKKFTFFDLFPSMMVGYLANNILPAKTGEIVKCYHLGKSKGVSQVSVLATVVVERIFDGITILLFLAISILFIKEGGSEKIWTMAIMGGLVYLGALAVILLIYFKKEALEKMIDIFCPNFFSSIFIRLTHSFSSGLDILRKPKQLITVFGHSFIMWVFTSLSLLPLIWMFDFDLPHYAPFFILGVICIGQTVPAAPGGIGIINFASVISLEILFNIQGKGVTETNYMQFASFSLLVNGVMVLPEIIIGAYFLSRSNIRWPLFSSLKE